MPSALAIACAFVSSACARAYVSVAVFAVVIWDSKSPGAGVHSVKRLPLSSFIHSMVLSVVIDEL